mmetsp:Transcript_25380/g.59442  ORF Transcript_25380/g.59442 Transcript_25380/m.59442 type:complete len:658 (-) Transcript_25380:103-2076(-)
MSDSQPPCRLLFRSKEGIEVFSVVSERDRESSMVASPEAADRRFLLKGETSFQALLPDGSAVLVHRPDKGISKVDLSGNNNNENSDPFFAQTSRVQITDVSPKGTYLLTWERGSSDESENNLKVWNTSTGECVAGFRRKMINRSSWPYLQWTHDEKFAFLLTTNEVRIYPGNFPHQSLTRYVDKIRVPGITQMSLPSSAAADGVGNILFAAFIAKDKNKPSRAALYEYPAAHRSAAPYPAIASKSLFQAEEMTVHWSPRGDAALIALQSTVDNTGQSYYGSSSLYLMSQQTTNNAIAVPLPQDGPVLDVAWMPVAEKPPCFAVAAGRMPSMASLHNGRDGKATFLFGNRHQNTISWAPHGRFVNLAGFGNLAGGMTFWDKNKGKQIPPANPVTASCTVGYAWSPDSRLFAVSTTSPRMNVSNGVSVYRYNGDQINNKNLPWNNDNYLPDRLLEATFIPSPPEVVYPDRPQSPSLKDLGTGPDAGTASTGVAATAPKPAGRYVPPSQRNRAGRGGNSLADRMRVEKEGKMLGAQKVTKNSGLMKRAVVGATGKVVVGMTPTEQKEGKSKSALRREKQQQKKKEEAARKELEEKLAAEQKAQEEANKPIDPVKRAKKINKVLRQIDDMKQKDPSELNDDQIEKIATEKDLRDELAKLSI